MDSFSNDKSLLHNIYHIITFSRILTFSTTNLKFFLLPLLIFSVVFPGASLPFCVYGRIACFHIGLSDICKGFVIVILKRKCKDGGAHELTHLTSHINIKFTNDLRLRILRNEKILGKSQNGMMIQLKKYAKTGIKIFQFSLSLFNFLIFHKNAKD